ncbi:MAG TPA: MFS transporter [Cryomorphaceae bacterium]|jgi:MFS transporter, SP family, xylose:H+ symportor|nr:MAG: MFS transporter [Cryomorphaceae bacterium BACL7 MAG-121220-bin83]HAG48443.1 MFS transporter [Cryomorphaceae bacterium]
MRNVQKWSWVVAVAGFLFGFDTVVISGANAPIRELWQTSAWFHGTFIMSMALWGTVLGSLFGGKPMDRWGRKPTLLLIGILFTVSAIGSALAWDPYSFSFFRFIGGVGVGASSVAAPAYISEISTAKNRGRLVALYQFNLVFGILIAFLSNYFLSGVAGAWDWRLMLGVEALPALVYTWMVVAVPESPRWLAAKKGDRIAALAVLQDLCDDPLEAQSTLDAICKDADATAAKPAVPLFSRTFRFPLLLAFLLAMFNQLSGINFILYYAPEILENAGFASSESLLSSVSLGGINLLFTFVGLYFIDRIGRKKLMYIGSVGYILSLCMVSYAFYVGASPMFTLTFILMFIASHAMGQGAVIWVFISEIFPNAVRGAGQSWGTGTHWVFAALITLLGPVVMESFPEGWPIFVFFAACMVLQLLFTHWIMPETKGKSLEELQHELNR